MDNIAGIKFSHMLSVPLPDDVYIIGAYRTPIGKIVYNLKTEFGKKKYL